MLPAATADHALAPDDARAIHWSLWVAVLLRVLLTPYWGLTPGQGAILLLVAAPGIALLSWLGSIFRQAPRNGLHPAGTDGRT